MLQIYVYYSEAFMFFRAQLMQAENLVNTKQFKEAKEIANNIMIHLDETIVARVSYVLGLCSYEQVNFISLFKYLSIDYVVVYSKKLAVEGVLLPQFASTK